MLCLNMFFCAVHVQEHHLSLGVEMPSEGTWHKNLTSHPKKPTLKISSLNLLFLLAVLVFYSFFGKGKVLGENVWEREVRSFFGAVVCRFGAWSAVCRAE